MKSVLITGGNGFIAKNLFEKLDAGKYDVQSVNRSQLNLLHALDVGAFFKKKKYDVVIHTATQNSTRNAAGNLNMVLENNLRMFFNLEQCRESYGKLISIGSGAEYDGEHYFPMMREEYFGCHVPKDSYGFSKYIMAKIAENEAKIIDLRIFGLFGPYEDWEIRFISNACCKAMYGLPITIRQNVRFDYMYVNDFVKIVEWFIDNDPSRRCYNVTTGKPLDLLSLAKKVIAASGKDPGIVVAREGMKPEYSGDNRRLMKEIGGFAFTDIDKAIRELYSWYENRKGSIDMSKLLIDK